MKYFNPYIIIRIQQINSFQEFQIKTSMDIMITLLNKEQNRFTSIKVSMTKCSN